MNSVKYTNRGNKKGSYFVEAAMTLPIFIICIVSISLLVSIIQKCEANVFEQSMLIHKADLEAPQIFPNVRAEGYVVKDFDYLYHDNGIDDLISLDTVSEFKVNNPIGIKGRIEFKFGILSRAFTGDLKDSGHLSVEDFKDGSPSSKVVVFPKYGERFHKKGCRYVLQDYKGEEVRLEMELKDAQLKGFTHCLGCGGLGDE